MSDGPNVIGLVTPPTAADDVRENIIRMLKETLELAERGELASVVMIVEWADGQWSHESSGTAEMSRDIGHLEIVKQRLIESYNRQWLAGDKPLR